MADADYAAEHDDREPEFGGHTAFGCEVRIKANGSCNGECAGCVCHYGYEPSEVAVRSAYMSEPWTPGPWKADAEMVHKYGPEEDQPGYLHVLTVADVANEEDARLISLAPEMAELLEGWVRLYEARYGKSIADPDFIRKSRALLARARGEEPESHGGDS